MYFVNDLKLDCIKIVQGKINAKKWKEIKMNKYSCGSVKQSESFIFLLLSKQFMPLIGPFR